MKEKPIIFSAPMVRAILEGRKTQTRRVVKVQPEHDADGKLFKLRINEGWNYSDCPYGQPGDQLWVRETFCIPTDFDSGEELSPEYRATCKGHAFDGCWKPSIHMPRRASRIDLKVNNIRVERLQDISEEDAKAEGVTDPTAGTEFQAPPDAHYKSGPKTWFAMLWQSIHGKGSWNENPWVWVVEFERMGL